jgi:urea transporter
VDKLTKRYSTISETKQSERPTPHFEVLGAFTRIILKRIVKKSYGDMRTGFIGFHTVINVHNIKRETEQGLLGYADMLLGRIFVEDLLQRKYVQHI